MEWGLSAWFWPIRQLAKFQIPESASMNLGFHPLTSIDVLLQPWLRLNHPSKRQTIKKGCRFQVSPLILWSPWPVTYTFTLT